MMQVLGLIRHFLKMERVSESHQTQFNFMIEKLNDSGKERMRMFDTHRKPESHQKPPANR